MQSVKSYMPIIHGAVFKKYGTYLPFNNKRTERLKFTLDDEKITEEARNKLVKVASERIFDRKPLPDGIRLVEAIIVEDK